MEAGNERRPRHARGGDKVTERSCPGEPAYVLASVERHHVPALAHDHGELHGENDSLGVTQTRTKTRLGVRQTESSRNRQSSLNILACSSRSAQPLSRLPPNLGLRRLWLGPWGLESVSFGLT